MLGPSRLYLFPLRLFSFSIAVRKSFTMMYAMKGERKGGKEGSDITPQRKKRYVNDGSFSIRTKINSKMYASDASKERGKE